MYAGPAPLAPASQRKRTPLRRATYAVLAPLIGGFLRAVWSTTRVRVVHGADVLETLRAQARPFVLCSWHDELLLTTLHFTKPLRQWGTPLAFMVSPSVDGDLATRVIERDGGRVVRGSATRSGVKVLRDLYRLMRKENVVPLVLPDGPTGPRHECKQGGLLLGQIAKAPVVPVACRAHLALRLPTWDRLAVPVPFTRVTLAIGEPVTVDGQADLEAETAAFQTRLDDLGTRCRS